jgi:hypothetical protein
MEVAGLGGAVGRHGGIVGLRSCWKLEQSAALLAFSLRGWLDVALRGLPCFADRQTICRMRLVVVLWLAGSMVFVVSMWLYCM